MTFLEIHGASVEYQQTGAGPDLLLLHSLLTEMAVFDRMLPALAKKSTIRRWCYAARSISPRRPRSPARWRKAYPPRAIVISPTAATARWWNSRPR